ncbi:MAG: glucans biosynthesis glucosyltransferase MdoH [Devosia sp.]|nr:glucans biosynthesis glucosyltransferase MdoH [Devosia sp.]
MMGPILVRGLALLTAAGSSLWGGYLFLQYTGADGISVLDLVRVSLVALSGFWLVWGATAAVLGVFTPARRPQFDPRAKPRGLTAILVPIYNEDPVTVFARIAAMNRSLVALGIEDRFHIAVLSDSNSLEAATEEAVWFEQLVREPASAGRIFYRRRENNVGKKAGNIEDFISRSGAAYDYALILDADSLMEGETIGELARRMDGDPGLGLLQTVPRVINAQTLFGRTMQFSAGYLSPAFARGASLMQGGEGPYWGHNAIVRVSAFAANCGLPVLSGKPPLGGHILSHDYVEAALLSRGGWTVAVDPALEGSFEEGPENLIEYAKRDRRWCQGNLQHWRLLGAPGLKWWSRFTFMQGVMAYVASPFWLLLLATSIVAAVFPRQPIVLPALPQAQTGIWGLALAVALVLVLPKVLILLRGMVDGQNRRVGGTFPALLSVGGEIVFSTILAPVMLLLQSRAVLQVLLGIDGGWPATQRGQSRLTLREAWAASWWIVLTGAVALGLTTTLAPAAAVWVVPATLPAILSPLLIAASSHGRAGARQPLLFRTPTEQCRSPVMEEHAAIVEQWTQRTVAAGQATGKIGLHVHA